MTGELRQPRIVGLTVTHPLTVTNTRDSTYLHVSTRKEQEKADRLPRPFPVAEHQLQPRYRRGLDLSKWFGLKDQFLSIWQCSLI